MLKKIGKLFFRAIIFIFLVFFLSGPAKAKSYSIPQVDIKITIRPDGSALVEEKRLFNFNGEFTFAFQEINKNSSEREKPYLLTDFKVCDRRECYQQLEGSDIKRADKNQLPETFYLEEKEKTYFVKWFYQANNQKKEFLFSYQIENAITLHQDIAELYWQLVGDNWEIPQKNIKAEIIFPPYLGDQDLIAWGHGPLSGVVTIPQNNLVTYQVDQIEPKTFVETRILAPKEIFNQGVSGQKTQKEIVAEEERFISQTIKKQKQFLIISSFVLFLTCLLPLIGLAIFIKRVTAFFKYQKDQPLPKVNLANRLWEPPSNVAPAQIESLLAKKKNLTPKAFTATILSLIQKRFLKLKRSRQKQGFFKKNYQYFLVKINKNRQAADPTQKKVLNYLNKIGFAKVKDNNRTIDNALSLKKIINWSKRNQTISHNFFNNLKESAFEENLTMGFFDKQAHKINQNNKPLIRLVILTIVQGFLYFSFLLPQNQANSLNTLGFFVLITSLMALMILKNRGEKLTDSGRQEAASWLAFKKHLKDYDKTKHDPIDSLVIWEKYLIYGTVLGISVKTLSQLPISFPKKDQNLANNYWGTTSGGNFVYFNQSLVSLGSALNNFRSQAGSGFGASGTGSSGGFSGGGGGAG